MLPSSYELAEFCELIVSRIDGGLMLWVNLDLTIVAFRVINCKDYDLSGYLDDAFELSV